MKIRVRKDLSVFARDEDFPRSWVVKDPLSSTHFLFSDREFFLLQQFDGQRSEAEILKAWTRRFKSALLTQDQLRQFVKRLVRDHLVLVDRGGAGHWITHEHRQAKRLSKFGWLRNPLVIRFRGINPTRVLRFFDWVGVILFHPAALAAVVMGWLLMVAWLIGHAEQVAASIPAIDYLVSTRGFVVMLGILAGVKILHELGHALACRRFGAECFEIGLMLLALIPTLYCNVSEAWTIKSRWRRMMVSFAGIHVELLIALVSGTAWILTPAGMINSILFQVMVICSVNSVLINGNPLMRYDGYYLLSDFWNRPNLAGHSRIEVVRFFRRLFVQPERVSEPSAMLLSYGLLAMFYRWMVVVTILVGIVWLVGRFGSFPLGYLIAGGLLTAIMGTQLGQVKLNGDNSTCQLCWWRTSVSMTGLLSLVGLVFLLPLPRHVYCDVRVESASKVTLFASSDGTITESVWSQARVKSGDKLVDLNNQHLKQKIREVTRRLEFGRNSLARLKMQAHLGTNPAARIAQLEQEVLAMEKERILLNSELRSLQVVAPTGGVLQGAACNRNDAGDSIAEAPPTSESVLEPNKLGSLVRRGDPIATIHDPVRKTVQLTVTETDIDFVERGQPVSIRFDQQPNSIWKGEVRDVVRQPVPRVEVPDQSVVESVLDRSGNRRMLQSACRVKVHPFEIPSQVLIGSTGRAKISVPSETIAARVVRRIRSSLANQF